VHGVGLAARRAAALRAAALVERGRLGERVAAAVGAQVLGQHDRQLLIRYRYLPARAAVDDRDRAAPVALARDTPVAQPVVHALRAAALRLERRGEGIDRAPEGEAGELARVHGLAVLGIGGDPGSAHLLVGAAGGAHHGDDGQVVLERELEVAL